MSRKTRDIRLEAEGRWPTLYQFLGAYCHQDWPEDYGTPEAAVDAAIADYLLPIRQQVLQEWRDWNSTRGAEYDPRSAVNDGFGVDVCFEKPSDARQFMNMVYDKLIVSVRNETSKDWKP
ncbi:contact-dependent growth inhibition system immunity protein [Erythrobacter sp. sf7]|uniref:Contact-dependent growth inhibition system immunity protein n=1 Tax=Erythrobacter fulvus TaxID=2987523 RepID=A0ABT5JK77_9SPHN|nr:contact-dependent growth inhibition system immunity protein [Erythrobacter fulvus]MDC8753067.1 contact-dependent growth inhibition system immunity protein [Erythrobacter fulvus]